MAIEPLRVGLKKLKVEKNVEKEFKSRGSAGWWQLKSKRKRPNQAERASHGSSPRYNIFPFPFYPHWSSHYSCSESNASERGEGAMEGYIHKSQGRRRQFLLDYSGEAICLYMEMVGNESEAKGCWLGRSGGAQDKREHKLH
ncbi:unnamed protein product [Dovyalis caffra]|uniref:Uncharacterized protein n=1 Tax=Dovyalis caffra TaxID=77055 RepID=A0AAV1RE37_9ROSI|nr:unnamed protein product [Dovyalis caffra]